MKEQKIDIFAIYKQLNEGIKNENNEEVLKASEAILAISQEQKD